jgi:branched-chain amino acid transport system ATP-binding protein
MLEVQDVHAYYGSYHVLKGVSLTVNEGEIATIIGPNGAGKTTLIKVLMGFLKCSGSIKFIDHELATQPPWVRVKMGMSVIPEGRRLFPHLTVHENLRMGAFLRNDAEIEKDMQTVFELFPVLQGRLKQRAGTLSGGEQQMLAIARALMTRPKLVLMDEPSLGLQPTLVDRVFETIKKLEELGVTTLLVEQNVMKALEVADRGYLMELGRIVLQGTTQDLRTHPDIKKTYLGG